MNVGSMSSENMGSAAANLQGILSGMEPAKLNGNIEEAIPVLAQNIQLLSAQLAAWQAGLDQIQSQAQPQKQVPSQTQSQIEQAQQEQEQQSPIGNKPKNSVALPVIPQAILISRRQNIEENHKDFNLQTIQYEPVPILKEQAEVALSIPAPPAPPPMIDLTPVATTLILPTKSATDPGTPPDSEDGTAKNVLLASLHEKITKSGFGLKKTTREPKEEKKKDSEQTVSFQFTLRKTRKETDLAPPKKDVNEKSNPILEQLTQVKLRKREKVTTEPNNTNEKVDASVATSPMEKSQEQKSSESFNFKAKLTPPIPNPKPSANQANTKKELDVQEELSVKFNTLKIKRTTSLQEKSSQSTRDVDDNEKIPMVEHIKKMMMRRKSQIYTTSGAASTSPLETSAHTEASLELDESIVEESLPREEIHTNPKSDSESILESSLTDFIDSKNEICQNNVDISISPVQRGKKGRKMDPKGKPKVHRKPPKPEATIRKNMVCETEDKLSPPPSLSPISINEKAQIPPNHKIDNIPIPPPPPPPPKDPSSPTGREDAPITKTQMTVKYTEKKTNVRDHSTTTTTQSFSGSSSSSTTSGTEEVQRPDALLNAIQSFRKEKLKSVSSNKKKMNSSFDRMTNMMNSMMASTLIKRGKAFHGDEESDSEVEVMSMDEDEWEE